MAWRAAQDLREGDYVNLGIGIPTLAASYVPPGREVIFHSENGILGMGPKPEPGKEDPNMVDAGKNKTTLVAGGCFVHHADAFLMIRGGHHPKTAILRTGPLKTRRSRPGSAAPWIWRSVPGLSVSSWNTPARGASRVS
jgi:3-oxoacid CoA-transferase B subunit